MFILLFMLWYQMGQIWQKNVVLQHERKLLYCPTELFLPAQIELKLPDSGSKTESIINQIPMISSSSCPGQWKYTCHCSIASFISVTDLLPSL